MKYSQSVLDAVNDAETLRLSFRAYALTDDRDWQRFCSLLEASIGGAYAIEPPEDDPEPEPEYRYARAAARAAFRAVPGLRCC